MLNSYMERRSAQTHCADESFEIRDLICSLGRPKFEDEFVRWVHQVYEADTVHVSLEQDGRPLVIMLASHDGSRAAERQCQHYMQARMWRFDADLTGAMASGDARPLMLHLDARATEAVELRNFYRQEDVGDRVLVCGAGPNGAPFGLSMIRSSKRRAFSEEQSRRLNFLSGTVFSLLVKHHQLVWQNRQLPDVITSLGQIEKHLALASVRIPRREGQVLARTLTGATAEDIGSELKISTETVITYRKSFYRRLGIKNFRELLPWYLRLHAEVGYRLVEYGDLNQKLAG
jgi:DNA-binding CsgD family transcriptional regulator